MGQAPAEIKAVRERVNELLGALRNTRRSRLQKEASLNGRIKKLQDKHSPEIKELQEQEDALVQQLTKLALPVFKQLAMPGTKTIRVRNGEVSLRKASQDALEVTDDESKIIRRIKGARGLSRFTRVGKRTLDKEALKKAPDFVARIKGLAIVRNSSLVIRPGKKVPELVLTAEQVSVPLPEED